MKCKVLGILSLSLLAAPAFASLIYPDTNSSLDAIDPMTDMVLTIDGDFAGAQRAGDAPQSDFSATDLATSFDLPITAGAGFALGEDAVLPYGDAVLSYTDSSTGVNPSISAAQTTSLSLVGGLFVGPPPTPEPGTVVMMLSGVALIGLAYHKKRSA